MITSIQGLPTSPYNNTGFIGIVITNGVPSYFRVSGVTLNKIVSVHWYPKNPSSVQFITRQMILVDDTEGTFMIQVTDNFLDINDRSGNICFRLDDNTTLSYPVKTYGPASAGRLWRPSSEGLITG